MYIGIKYTIINPITAPVNDNTRLTSTPRIPKSEENTKKNIEYPTKI